MILTEEERRCLEDSIYCTSGSAAWCPIHGDCTCDREVSMDDKDCPLHNGSNHDEGELHDYTDEMTWLLRQ